jgi:chromosome partitioning protein
MMDSDFSDSLGSDWDVLGKNCQHRASCDASLAAYQRSKGPSMQTIVLATQKGGSGKSTLAIGLARAAIQVGHTVRLIETDAQGTLSNWQNRRPYAEPLVEPIHTARDIAQRLLTLPRDGATLTIVDTASGSSAATSAAIRLADLCLIPARPSIADVESAASTLRMVRACKKPFAFVLNQTPIRGRRIDDAATALGDGSSFDLTGVVARPFIVMRNDHQDALNAGLAVSEFAPASKSADEIRRLWQWVEAKLYSGLTGHVESGGELADPLYSAGTASEADARWDACL